MLRAIADTHSVIWYLFADRRLSKAARSTIDTAAEVGDQVGLSAITLVEIIYLSEKNRIHPATLERLFDALGREGSVLEEIPFDRTVARAMLQVERRQVPDMPDRIIAATAVALGLPLISRDSEIRVSGIETIW